MTKKIWVILIIGIILRVFLSLSTFHPDIQVFDLSGQILKKGNILSLYDYLYNLSPDDKYLKSYPPQALNYPPATYILLGGSSLLFTSLTPPSIHEDFLFNTKNILGSIYLNLHLLSLKLLLFLFDLGCAYLLYKFFDNLKTKLLAFILWIFNPVTLFATFMMGQYDVIATFFVILSLYIVKKGKESSVRNLTFASILLGIGVAFKIYPVLFIIPLAALAKSWLYRCLVVCAGIIPYILTILPFLQSSGFKANALFANQLNKSFFAQLPISGGESIILFLAALIFSYFVFLQRRLEKNNLWQSFFIIALIFFIFTHFHPQWFLWLTPFLIIEIVKSQFRNFLALLVLFLSWFLMLFFFDSSLTLGLFAPVNPALYQSKTFWQILNINIDFNFSRSLLQTFFVGAAFYFIYSYFPKKDSNSV